jgi:heptosyltransferase-2
VKIALWNTAFLGDAVLTLPLIHTLAQGYPGADIHFYVRAGLEGLFAAQPELAGVHGFAKRGGQAGLAGAYALGRAAARERFDLWISAHSSLRSALIARWSSAPRRIGYSRPLANQYFYTTRWTAPSGAWTKSNACCVWPSRWVSPRWPSPAGAPGPGAGARGGLFAARGGEPVLGIHPGSTWPTKQWPPEYFSRVRDMALDAGMRVARFAGPGEEALARGVLAGATSAHKAARVAALCGALSLPELAAHIGGLGCYLTGDSGPMHLAWVQGVPVTAIFGPTVRRLGFFPRGERSTVLEVDLPCRPCSLHGPRQCPQGHHRCMRDVTPEAAFASVAAQMGMTP